MTVYEAENRARLSQGRSASVIYAAVQRILRAQGATGGRLCDVGCGVGALWPWLQMDFSDYVGVDVVRYDDFPTGSEFHPVDLNAMEWALSGLQADVVVAVETIEHLENPRAFFRNLGRLAKPGGWVLVSTPNNLSGLSKLTLLTKNCFNAFQNNQYPAHLTALLEIDLRRMAQETGMEEVTVAYTEKGRIPGTSWHYPSWLSRSASQTFSDNVLLLGRKIL